MSASFMCMLLLSPSALLELTIDQPDIRKEIQTEDRIGLFLLKDGEKSRLVLLYCFDSDTAAEKARAKNEPAIQTYPNIFSVNAVYRNDDGKWTYEKVFGFARVRFVKVTKATTEKAVLECRPNFIIIVRPNEDVETAMKNANRPFTMSVFFANGRLVAKDDRDK